MTEDDFDYAHDQYFLAIVNDNHMYHKLQKELRGGTFNSFNSELEYFINSLRLKHKLQTMDVCDKVYIRLMVIHHLLTAFEVKQLFDSEPKLCTNHVKYCRTKGMIWLIDRLLRNPVVKPIKATPEAINGQPETTQENTMPSIEIKNVTFINNTDVNHMTDEQLIGAIKNLEQEISDLEAVKSKSVAIGKKVGQLNETLLKVVAILDAR
jgi:hypothetical protein